MYVRAQVRAEAAEGITRFQTAGIGARFLMFGCEISDVWIAILLLSTYITESTCALKMHMKFSISSIGSTVGSLLFARVCSCRDKSLKNIRMRLSIVNQTGNTHSSQVTLLLVTDGCKSTRMVQPLYGEKSVRSMQIYTGNIDENLLTPR